MYCINDKQIDHILNDIRARGVEMEDLQLNLLDHICCIIEQDLEENGDFESFYQKTIKTFYKDELWEIEEETLSLLLFKNYYTMKKIMIVSGIVSTFMLMSGIIFKFLYWPGAATLIILGILLASLVFLPLLFTLKAREKQAVKDKFILAVGALSAMLISLSFLFRIMHWPFSLEMLYVSTFMMLILFMPVYFYAGIRNPTTKVNTITSSVLIILGYCLLLSMVASPRSSQKLAIRLTNSFLRSEQLVKNERQQLDLIRSAEHISAQAKAIMQSCEEIKAMILQQEVGSASVPDDFEAKHALIRDRNLSLDPDNPLTGRIEGLKQLVESYNEENKKTGGVLQIIPVKWSLLDMEEDRAAGALYNINQIELFVLQNEQKQLALK